MDRTDKTGRTDRTARHADRQLIARLHAGDEGAVQELAERYGAKIFQLAIRYMKNREDAEEVAQDVLMKVYRKVDAFRGDAALSSWIYRITFNAAMSRLRGTRLARAATRDIERLTLANADGERPQLPRQCADWSQMPDEAVFRLEARRAVTEAIRSLPDIYRAAIVLRDIKGLTTEEASQQLQLNDQTLKSRLHRGRLLLRGRLQGFTGGLGLRAVTPAYS